MVYPSILAEVVAVDEATVIVVGSAQLTRPPGDPDELIAEVIRASCGPLTTSDRLAASTAEGPWADLALIGDGCHACIDGVCFVIDEDPDDDQALNSWYRLSQAIRAGASELFSWIDERLGVCETSREIHDRLRLDYLLQFLQEVFAGSHIEAESVASKLFAIATKAEQKAAFAS